MYRLIYEQDADTGMDECIPEMNIEVSIDDVNNGITYHEMFDHFKQFLVATGYGYLYEYEVDINKPEEIEEPEIEEVELDLSDETFNRIALLAHEEDITLNAKVVDLLRAYMDDNTITEEIYTD